MRHRHHRLIVSLTLLLVTFALGLTLLWQPQLSTAAPPVDGPTDVPLMDARPLNVMATPTAQYLLYAPLIDRVPPGYPSAPYLSFSQLSRNEVQFNWSEGAEAHHYILWQWNGYGGYGEMLNPRRIYAGTTRSFNLTLPPGRHYFHVQAVNKWGATMSNVIDVTVVAPSPTPTITPSPMPTMVPVTPPANLPTRFYSVADAVVADAAPNLNLGSTVDMAIGYEECDFESKLRSLVRFDLSAVPHDAHITSAKLYLYLEGSCAIPGKSYPVDVYPAASAWSETAVTWNNQPATGSRVSTKTINGRDWRYHDFDVTSLVRVWLTGAQPNYGIVLRSLEYSGSDTASLYFFTREYSDASVRPYLQITYAGQAAEPSIVLSEGEAAPRPGGLRVRDLLAPLPTQTQPPDAEKTSQYDLGLQPVP